MGSSSSFYQELNNTPSSLQTAAAIVAQAQASANAAAASAAIAAQLLSVGTDAWTSTMNINWAVNNVQRITLAGNTAFTFVGGNDGARLILELTQDGTGSRTITLPSSVHFGSTVPYVTLSTTAGKKDRLGFIYNATNGTYDLVAVAYGY